MTDASLLSAPLDPSALVLAVQTDTATLVSWWKALLILPPFLGWLYVVAHVYDKFAARFFLPRETWNLVHLVVGLVAVLVAFSFPVEAPWGFFVGWFLMVLILAADLLIFMKVANKDERVPESKRLKLDLKALAGGGGPKVDKKAGVSELVLRGADKQALPLPQKETPEFAVRMAAEQWYLKALESRAGQVDVAPSGKDQGYAVRFLVDGVATAGPALPAAEALKAMDLWKSAAKLDVADRRKKLTGDITVERGVDKKKVRVTSLGASGGMRLTLLIDPEGQVRRSFDDLGLLEPQAAELKTLAESRKGLVLLAAPADGGRTTTLYSVLKLHDAYTQNVQTVELDIQDTPEGVRQTRWDAQAEGPEYSTLVRSILRREPEVLGVAEVPDQATAKEICRSEADRVRVYVSLRAGSAGEAVESWVRLVGNAEEASKGLHGVVSQRLVRKLCMNCRVPYVPAPELLKKLGLPADKVKQLFKKGGQVLVKNKPEVCPVCQGTGYVGQAACFEVFSIDQAGRDMIAQQNWAGFKAELRKKQLPTILQSALRRAIDGTTSVEEVTRVTASSPASDAPPAAKAPAAAAGPKPA
jgi:type II secretory ATPase GspE/PulE/Tfp pilus assembly ATPase PilB-like protein